MMKQDRVRTPVQEPNANAYAERLIGTLRTNCLDRMLILGRRHHRRRRERPKAGVAAVRTLSGAHALRISGDNACHAEQ
jgi:hypothetical protein